MYGLKESGSLPLVFDRLDSQSCRMVGLASSGASDTDHVLGLVAERPLVQCGGKHRLGRENSKRLGSASVVSVKLDGFLRKLISQLTRTIDDNVRTEATYPPSQLMGIQ